MQSVWTYKFKNCTFVVSLDVSSRKPWDLQVEIVYILSYLTYLSVFAFFSSLFSVFRNLSLLIKVQRRSILDVSPSETKCFNMSYNVRCKLLRVLVPAGEDPFVHFKLEKTVLLSIHKRIASWSMINIFFLSLLIWWTMISVLNIELPYIVGKNLSWSVVYTSLHRVGNCTC